jgi:cytochrome P450
MFVYLSSCAGHPGSQDPRWRAAVIEETLRLACPFTRTTLITRGGVQLAGLDIPAGTALELRWAAGNRDPAVFGADAGEFVPGRDGGAKHWAFGRGVHACAGAAMARLVMDAALAAVSVDGAELASVKVGTGMVDGPTEAVLLLPAAGC